MRAMGIVRKIDSLGRIVIPKEVRDAHGWDKGQPMEMFMDNDNLVIRSYDGERQKEEVLNKLEWVEKNTTDNDLKETLSHTISSLKSIL